MDDQFAGGEAPSPPPGQIELEERLNFLQLGADDAERLRQVAPHFARLSREFVDSFYRHLFAFPRTAELLGAPEQVESLKKMQIEHLLTMLAAQWDDNYTEQRHRVGQAHARRGIEPTLFLGAYNQYLQFCLDHHGVYDPENPAAARQVMGSIVRAVLLDVGLTLDAYFHQATQDLQQALELYWQTNQELRRFAELASHDLKTPIGTVANLCDEVLDEFGGEMPPEARDMVDRARRVVLRMGAMIDELLEVAVRHGSSPAEGVEPLESVVREAWELVQPEAAARGIRLELPEDWPPLRVDRVRLREVLMNLLGNAVKFIDKEPGYIRINCHSEEHEIVLTVEDNGPGISPEDLPRLFAPFRRLDRHKGIPGSGLGLYFARSLMVQVGGRLSAEPSPPGRGARFSVTLPRRESSASKLVGGE